MKEKNQKLRLIKSGHRPVAISPAFRLAKRCFDIVFSLTGLILFSPAFLLIYIAIKLDDHGAAIFKQERIGYKGKSFIIYKFRSMDTGAEADGTPALCPRENTKHMTRVGSFLRRHHLDELPQLWNVLKGEMSAVGYRPERPYFVEKIKAINPDYELLYQIRPGIFSEATLYNGYTDTMEKMQKRLDMDLYYLHNASPWIDTRIVFLTVCSILFGKKF